MRTAPRRTRLLTPAQLLGPWAIGLVGTLLVALIGLLGWYFVENRARISRMMSERSATMTRMVATEVRNVARYGKAQRQRVDQVLSELAASADITGVRLERDDGAVVIAHGSLPEQPEGPAGAPRIVGTTLLCAKRFRIETHVCGQCHDCQSFCTSAGGIALDGTYVVSLGVDARPYLKLRRALWLQGGAGLVLVLILGAALWSLRRQAGAASAMGQALAAAEERGRSLERIGLLAGGLAHEIKNPVGSLRGFAQLIAERVPPGSKEHEYASLMVSELDGLTRRVDRLKDIARPEPPRLVSGRPVEIIRRVTSLLMPDAQAAGVQIVLDLPDGAGPQALIDHERFRDLVVNLLTNAIDASPEGGSVIVSLHRDPKTGGLSLEVNDEGPGIPAEERDRVIQPFHSTKPSGLGLGLVVAQQAAEDHGGRIELADSPRGGLSARAHLWSERSPRGSARHPHR